MTGKNHEKTTVTALYLFTVIFVVYLLSYNGFPGSDDEQLFISAGINLAHNGELNASQLLGNERLAGQYFGIGPLHVALGSLFYRAASSLSLGGMQAMFLAAPLYLALCGVLVYLLSQRWGYSSRSGVCAALLFAFCSMSWVYARTFFREPLAAFLFLTMWLAFDFMDSTEKCRRFFVAALVFILAWMGLLFTRVTMAFVPLLFLLAFLFKKINARNKSCEWKKQGGKLALMLCVVMGLIMLFLFKTNSLPQYVTNRVSDEIFMLTWTRIRSMTHAHFVTALFGSLISPGKGFLVYSPVLLLGVASTFRYPSKMKEQNLIVWGLLAVLVVEQGLIYDAGWWNVTWSTRYLMPAVAGLILLGLPILEHLQERGNILHKVLFSLLVSTSFLITLGGVLMDTPAYNAFLYQTMGKQPQNNWLWQPYLAPFYVHWKFILSGTETSFAASHISSQYFVRVIIYLVSEIALLLAGLGGLIYINRSNDKRLSVRYLAFFLTFVVLTVIPWAVLSTSKFDVRYHTDRSELHEAFGIIESAYLPGDQILLESYLSPVWYYAMNFSKIAVPWVSLPPVNNLGGRGEEEELSDFLRGKFEEIDDGYQRLWYVTENTNSNDIISLYQPYFDSRFPILMDEVFSPDHPGSELRVILYDLDEK